MQRGLWSLVRAAAVCDVDAARSQQRGGVPGRELLGRGHLSTAAVVGVKGTVASSDGVGQTRGRGVSE